MRRKPIQPMHADHVNVTPLIDVMMCLIIFFLLCGQFAKNDSNDKVEIPRAGQGQKLSDMRGSLLINVVPAEAADAPPGIMIRARNIRPEELSGYLAKEKSDNPDLKVIIRADQNLAYNYISPVLAACAQANIRSVNFSTRKED